MIVGMVGTHTDDLAPLKDEIVNIIDDSQPYDTKAWQDKALYHKKLDGIPTKELPENALNRSWPNCMKDMA